MRLAAHGCACLAAFPYACGALPCLAGCPGLVPDRLPAFLIAAGLRRPNYPLTPHTIYYASQTTYVFFDKMKKNFYKKNISILY